MQLLRSCHIELSGPFQFCVISYICLAMGNGIGGMGQVTTISENSVWHLQVGSKVNENQPKSLWSAGKFNYNLFLRLTEIRKTP